MIMENVPMHRDEALFFSPRIDQELPPILSQNRGTNNIVEKEEIQRQNSSYYDYCPSDAEDKLQESNLNSSN